MRLAIACLFLIACVDFDALVAPDASRDAGVDGGADAGVDAPLPEASSDAPVEVGEDVSAPDAGTFFCESRCVDDPKCFCADFDQVAMPSTGWEESTAGGGATNFFVEDVRSLPRSVLMTAPGSTTGVMGSSFVVYKRAFLGTERTILIEGEWQLQDFARTSPGNFEFFSVTIGGARVALGASWEDSETLTWRIGNTVGGMTRVYDILAPPTGLGTWVHFVLEVHFDDTEGSIMLRWNEDEVLNETTVSTSPVIATDDVTLSASFGGGTLQGNTPDLWMLFDNLQIRVRE